MRERLSVLIPGLLMHIFFGLCCAISWVLVWPFLVLWIFTGNEKIRDWIYNFGKAEDQAANAALFFGEPQETISSHVGRIFEKRIADDISPPWWARLIKWITDGFEFEHVLNSVEKLFEGESL